MEQADADGARPLLGQGRAGQGSRIGIGIGIGSRWMAVGWLRVAVITVTACAGAIDGW